MYSLKKNTLGFYQVDPMPGSDELQAYYSQKYYQAPAVKTFSLSYTEEERKFGRIAPDVADFIFKHEARTSKKTLFDIGCGEGFFMDNLHSMGWKVKGTDYSEAGIEKHNPHLHPFVTYKPAMEDINDKIAANEKFSLVNLGNILEHVIDPVDFLNRVKNVISKDGLLRVVVPNDDSEFQQMLERMSLSKKEWFHPPDHLSYFNFETLPLILSYTGFQTVKMLGDFPIEIFLLHEKANYFKNKDTGAAAHFVRVMVSNFIRDRGLPAYIKWAESLAEARLSRSCIFYCRIILR